MDRTKEEQGDHFPVVLGFTKKSISGERSFTCSHVYMAYRQIKQKRSTVATSSPLLDVHQESYIERNKVG